MTSRSRVMALVALATFTLASGPARAQETRKYEMIRADEDWAWLDENPPETTDAFDAVKHAEFGEQWYTSLGGMFRMRYEDDENRRLSGPPILGDDDIRLRAAVNFEVGHAKDFRFYTEVRAADTLDETRPVAPFFHDDPDFLAFFVEGTVMSESSHPLTFRAGRQEMKLGAGRLVSPLDWWSTRRSFEGLRIIADTPRTSTSVFAVNTVDHEPHDADSRIEEQSFYGVYSTFKPTTEHLIDAYALVTEDTRDLYSSEAGIKGDVQRTTLGLRYAYTGEQGWRAEVEAAAQRGDLAGDDVNAWFATASFGYKWAEAAWKPRLLVGVDSASGDEDPTDGDAGTFDPLFPDGHLYLGSMDLVGRSNIQAARLEVEVMPLRRFKWTTTLHRFWLAEDRDALYDSNGKPLRRDVTGASGDDVGYELDVMLGYTFKTHHWVGFEYCQWWSGDFVQSTGYDDDAWFAWVAYEFTF